MKTKKTSTLKAKLDKIFSEYIRLRDSKGNGYCNCISCGKYLHWKEMDCGHFVNRSHMGTRYSEKNCNAQCRKCNRFDEGNNLGYTRGLIKKYGVQVLNELEMRKHAHSNFSPFDYEVMIEHYVKEVKKIKEQKGIP